MQLNETNDCIQPIANGFPPDIFTREQNLKGAISFHIAVSLYLFIALAILCEKYFVPAVEQLCKELRMSVDAVGGVVIAAALSMPTLLLNIYSTFITNDETGTDTTIGTALFNILVISACCGFCAPKEVFLNRWYLTRDFVAYLITISMLIFIIHNEIVRWYEALALVTLYFIYTIVIYWDDAVRKMLFSNTSPDEVFEPEMNNVQVLSIETIPANKEMTLENVNIETINTGSRTNENTKELQTDWSSTILDLLEFPSNRSLWQVISWTITLPINILFLVTIPDCKRKNFKHWFPLTLIISIFWLGCTSYAINWMIVIIGNTLRIPESLMGFIFLAIGSSIPDIMSTVVVAKQGRGSTGISILLGVNTFDILLCLGAPWLIKTIFVPVDHGRPAINVNFRDLEYGTIWLLLTCLCFYCLLAVNGFKLNRKISWICLAIYVVFLIFVVVTQFHMFGFEGITCLFSSPR